MAGWQPERDVLLDEIAARVPFEQWVGDGRHEIGAASDGIRAALAERAERGLYLGDEQRGEAADDRRVTTEDICRLS
jgi:hypothetical protein